MTTTKRKPAFDAAETAPIVQSDGAAWSFTCAGCGGHACYQRPSTANRPGYRSCLNCWLAVSP